MWRAQIVDSDQYLDIDLGRIQPVYGVEVSGDAVNVEYVQAYQVLYSSDGVSYSYAKPAFGEDKVNGIVLSSIELERPVTD